jgi:hypothetical protein
MALAQFLSLPAIEAGKAPVSSASAWAFGNWVEISASITTDIYLIGIQFQLGSTKPSLDTTTQQLFEIGIGGSGAEVTKLQFPYSFRKDTAVGYYHTKTINVFLPEPYFIQGLSRVAVRATDSIASAITYTNFKIFYREGGVYTVKALADSVTMTMNSPAKAEYHKGADSVTMADSRTDVITFLRTLSDSVSMSEVITKLLGHTQSLTDNVAMTELLTRTITFLRRLPDSVTMSDLAKLNPNKLNVDNVTMSDLLNSIRTFSRTNADSVTITDLQAWVQHLVRTFTDSITMTDSRTDVIDFVRTKGRIREVTL